MTNLSIESHGTGIPVVFLHGSFGWGVQSFPRQLGLQDRHRLLFVDRRGFGRSPGAEHDVDFEVDARDLIEILVELGEPAHVVGHSYGAVPSLLAAQERPELFRSTTLVEPSTFSLLRDDPAVEELIGRLSASIRANAGASPRDFLQGFVAAMGYEAPDLPEPDALMSRSILASVHERRPWEAEIDLPALQRAAIPTLIVSGAWNAAPAEARRIGGSAFHAVAEFLERELPARRILVGGAAHNPQMVETVFNGAVEAFWSEVEGSGSALR